MLVRTEWYSRGFLSEGVPILKKIWGLGVPKIGGPGYAAKFEIRMLKLTILRWLVRVATALPVRRQPCQMLLSSI